MHTLVIIGGGIGGLAAAACLKKRGIKVDVYEQAESLAEVGAAIALWPNASRVLRHLVLLDALAGRAYCATQGALRDHRGRLLQQMAAVGDAPTLFMHRAALQGVLRSAVPAERLHLGKRCATIERDGAKVRATFADGTASAWADGLVGADGIRSVVRALTLADGAPVYRGYVAWRGVANCVTDVGGETWGDRGRRFGLIPLGDGRVGWWATANVKEPGATVMREGPAAWKADVLRRFRGWHAPIQQIVEQTPGEAVLCNTIDDRPAAAVWGEGGVTLLGDAAHPSTPNLGQGACMAIEDAAVLAHAVEAVPEIGAAFRVYEATRRARTAEIVRESMKFGRLGQWEMPLACGVRNRLMGLLPAGVMEKRMRKLWSYDAWNEPLMMPR